MLDWPISSPKMTRMFGRCAAGATGCCCARTVRVGAIDPRADTAVSAVLPRRMCRLLGLRSCGSALLLRWSALAVRVSSLLTDYSSRRSIQRCLARDHRPLQDRCPRIGLSDEDRAERIGANPESRAR